MTSQAKDISTTPAFGKSLRVFEVEYTLISELYEKGDTQVPQGMKVFPNQPLVLKAGNQSALAMVSKNGKFIKRADDKVNMMGISGRNKEQALLMYALTDPEIRCVVVTGLAGSGKTIMLCAHALEQVMERKKYEKMFLSKPLSVVTSGKFWGTLPGNADEKFAPYLTSYEMQFETLVGESGVPYLQTLKDKGTITFMPLELMRGVSLKNCIAWFDEVQNCTPHELATLGTRIDDKGNSKLILSGDLNQRDVLGLRKQDTGLMQMLKSHYFLNSPLTFHINLIKCERGKVAELFHNIFESEED